MRKRIIAAVICIAMTSVAQQAKTPATLKSILLQELRETHNQKNWFVSEKEAAGGLTPEQAAWSDGKNHSVGQLVQHLNYWNQKTLVALQGHREKATDNNDETFDFDPKNWDATQKQYDTVMSDFENLVESANDTTLSKIAPSIARVSQHNAYHIAEMVTSRKKQGTWNPENGVK